MVRFLSFVFLLFTVISAHASEDVDERPDEYGKNRVSINGSLTSSDSYSLEAAYHYMISPYVGLGGAFGLWENYFIDGYASGTNWHIDSDYEKPSNLYLRPSVVLKSPGLRFRGASLHAYAEPGVMLNIPYCRVGIANTTYWPETEYDYVSTTKGQWFAFDMRLGVGLDIEGCSVSLGYVISNLDIYSQYRHLSYQGISFRDFYPKKSITHGAFLSLSYRF